MRRLRLILLYLPLATVALLGTGVETPSPQAISVFGLPPAWFEPHGMAMYPPNGEPKTSVEEAIEIAEKRGQSDVPPKAASLVRMVNQYEKFDGMVWVVALDVAGKPAFGHRGFEADGTRYVNAVKLVLVDAQTGAWITTIGESVSEDLPPVPFTGPVEY